MSPSRWIRRLKDNRTAAQLALIASRKRLSEVEERSKRVDQVVREGRLLRDENHFKESLLLAMRGLRGSL